MRYQVYVDDNYHYMDQSYRYKLGSYWTFNGAVKASKKIVDEFLVKNRDKCKSHDELFASYCMYGEDPFIMAKSANLEFSSRTYAENKCKKLYEEK